MRSPHEIAVPCYLLLGTAVVLIGAVGVFGGMFSSFTFAAASLLLVVVPVVTALVLLMTRSVMSPVLMLVGCCSVMCFVCSVFLRDFQSGAPPTAFIHEPWGWIALVFSVLEICVSLWIIALGRRSRNRTA